MKLNGTFTVREVAGEILAIPVGKTALELNGMIILNPVSRVIWERLSSGASRDEIVHDIMGTFEVDARIAASDLEEFLEELRTQNLLVE